MAQTPATPGTTTDDTREQSRGGTAVRSGSVAQEVFLTPRVVDAGTFAAFSATLRELLADAEERRRSLTVLNGEVASLRDALRGLTTELEAKLLTAVKVIPAIDQRLSKVNDALTFAEAVVRAQAASDAGTSQSRDGQSDAANPPTVEIRTSNADTAAEVATIVRHAEERLSSLVADARGTLDATIQVHIASAEQAILVPAQRAELAISQRLHELALGLEADSRSRLEGVLIERVEAEIQERVEKHIEQRVRAVVDERVRQTLEEFEMRLQTRIGDLIEGRVEMRLAAHAAEQNAKAQCNEEAQIEGRKDDPQVTVLRQQVAELSHRTQRIEGMLNDHSGLVAAQSAHSALVQMATQAAGLGQHLEVMTRRAEMTLHALAGVMSQFPHGLSNGSVGGMGAGLGSGFAGGMPPGAMGSGIPPTFAVQPPYPKETQR